MQIYSNRELQKQKDELLKASELSDWEQKFVTDLELKAVECLTPKEKNKITEIWEKRCS